VGRTGAEA